jgi:hypothetical protein
MAAHIPQGADSETKALHEALAAFCTQFVRGELPELQRDLFCGARLIPIAKKPSGIRPIAVGETLRRLAAKCLVEKHQAAVIEYLEPLQLGVGVRGATEAIIHRVKEWLHSGVPADHALLLLDFSNAFNTLDRTAMLRAISERCPHFLPYARFCYGAPTPLLGPGCSLNSQCGTQQGDACGPLFFAVTVHPLAVQAAQAPDTTLAAWFLDDGSQAGSVAGLAEAVAKLEPAAAAIGLKLNRAKCKLFGPGLLDDLPAPLRGILWVPWTSGVRVLGTPVGRSPFVRAELAQVYAKLEAALDKLQCLGDPQAASHLLRCCLGAAKVVHLLRTASYTECAAFAKKVRALLKSAWGTVIGATLTEAHWSLASLPVRLGGFGASDPVIIHPQAAVASFLSAASGRAGLPLTRLDPDLRDAVEGLCLTLPEMAAPLRDLWLSVSLPVLLDDPRAESWAEQKVWNMRPSLSASTVKPPTVWSGCASSAREPTVGLG